MLCYPTPFQTHAHPTYLEDWTRLKGDRTGYAVLSHPLPDPSESYPLSLSFPIPFQTYPHPIRCSYAEAWKGVEGDGIG